MAETIVAAMQRHGARRPLVASSIGVGDSTRATLPIEVVVATFLRASTPDEAGTEDVVRGSGLDRVITRPAVLTDHPATGEVRALSADSGERARSITRADLAAFLVAQLTSDDHLSSTVTLANG